MNTSYQTLIPISTGRQREFTLNRWERAGRKTIWIGHIRAAYVAEWFIHARGSKRALMAHVNHGCGGQALPLGEPDYMIYETTEPEIRGSVVALRATWPSENELAL